MLKTYKIKGYGVPRIVAEAVVDAPAAALFAIVSDCRNIKQLVDAVDAVKLISRTATRHRCWIHVDTPFPFSALESTMDYRKRVTPTRATMSFKMVTGDYLRNRGTWTFTPFDTASKRTLVRYDLHCVPKMRSPDAAITWGTERNIRGMLKKLRKMVR